MQVLTLIFQTGISYLRPSYKAGLIYEMRELEAVNYDKNRICCKYYRLKCTCSMHWKKNEIYALIWFRKLMNDYLQNLGKIYRK
jgi:hypothetical protein